MARRRYSRRRHSRGGMKLPIISLAILGGQIALANARGATLTNKVDEFQSLYTGFSFEGGQFLPANLLIGYGPWLLKRFLLPMVNPGRALARAHLPVSMS